MYDLDRFVTAQAKDYAIALREIRNGKKTSHWMWYIFPQLASLGSSDRSKYYGLEGLGEAKAYLDDPVLGDRYLACVEALLAHHGEPIDEIMGHVDAKKLRSSLTLMDAAGGGPLLRKALDVFYGGTRCDRTVQTLRDG
jgi:uncharacterized protein (DUF1810 family)